MGQPDAAARAALEGTARALLGRVRRLPRLRRRLGLPALGLCFLALAATLIPVVGFLVAFEPGAPLDAGAVLNESAARAPFLFSAGLAVLGATVYVDWRDRRETGFRLLDRLNGEPMLRARHALAARMRAADGRADLEALRGWFPTGTAILDGPEADFDRFRDDHALFHLASFAYEVRLYDAQSLLDRRGAAALLRLPFSHFQIPLLELAAALRAERRRLDAEGFALGADWDAMAEGIEGFQRMLALADALPAGHRFWYFPSLNRDREADPA